MSRAFAARYSITYVEDLGGGVWRLTGKIYDDSTAGYLAGDVVVGDVIVDESALYGTTNRWQITQIDLSSIRDLVCRVVWDDQGMEDPNGPAACEASIARPSTICNISEVPTQAFAKVSEVVQTSVQCINNRLNVDEIPNNIHAGNVSYDNSSSGLTATDVQAAIDEVNVDFESTTSYVTDVIAKINRLGELTPTITLLDTDPDALNTAIGGLNDGDVLEVRTNATYNPITIPGGKAFSVKVTEGYSPAISGQGAIRVMNGAANVILSGLTCDTCTPGNSNYEGAAITYGEQHAIVHDLIFHALTFRNCTGSSVMLSYHWSVGGDLYYTAPTYPDEFSIRVAFVACEAHKATTDATEGAALCIRGIELPLFLDNAIDNFNTGGRGIQMQDCVNVIVDENEVYNCPGEGIKLDEIGTMVGYKNSGVIKNNRVRKADEGIDIDDACGCLVMDNICWDCTGRCGLSLDDSSMSFFLHNICFNNDSGIILEASSVANLKKNICFNNTTNYNILNGYVKDDSNSELMGPSLIGADSIPYDPTSSGLSSKQVQAAIDELSAGSSGDVVGPASATANGIALYNGTTGKLIKDGPVIGTAANNVVQLDGTAKLPAVDGSQLTNLPSGSGDVVGPASATNNALAQFNGTTGKLIKDGPSIGTAANNLVQLDGTAKLPAVDGSQLTNIPKVIAYTADSTSGEEILVKATETGITASRSGNIVTFVIPSGAILLSARIRIAGANLVAGAMIVDLGAGYTGAANRWSPNCHAWREDSGTTLAITVTMDTSNFNRVTVNSLNATVTNNVIINL